MRRNLVIVRAGDTSLHPGWLEGAEKRNWDLVVSYFGRSPDLYREPDTRRIDGAGPKWPALYELLTSQPSLLDGYDYVWLPDDDLRTDKASINRMFMLMASFGLEVAQPTLTWDSYFGHVTTLQDKSCSVRFTNYVEVMAPCLSVHVLRQALPILNANISGWGLDFIWKRWVSSQESSIGMLDLVTVCHTRPVGGPNYQKLREGGISPWDELRAFCRAQGMDEAPTIETYSAILKNNRHIAGPGVRRRLAFRFVWNLVGAWRQTPQRGPMMRRMTGMIWKATLGIPDRVAETGLLDRLLFRRSTEWRQERKV